MENGKFNWAKSNIKDLRSDSTKDIDSIKKEAELSLDELNKIKTKEEKSIMKKFKSIFKKNVDE